MGRFFVGCASMGAFFGACAGAFIGALGLMSTPARGQIDDPNLDVAFTGGSGNNFAPPDTDGAIGSSDYVQFINGRFAVYAKTTGTQRLAESDTSFWNAAGIGTTITSSGLSDTRVIFDPLVNRWFATEINTPNTGTQVLVGRSDTQDPAGAWHATNYTGNTGFADYPTLGADANGVFIGTTNFTSGVGSLKSASMTSIPIADLLLTAPSVTRRTTVEQTNFAMGRILQGVANFGASPSHATVVAANASSLGRLNMTRITGSNSSGATFGPTTVVTVQSTSSPNLARQPDGTRQVDGNDGRIAPVTYQVGDNIYIANGISVNAAGVAVTSGGVSDAIRVTVLSDTNQTVVAEATYFNSAFDYIYPSIAANANGQMVIGFTRSGSAQGSGNTTGNLSVGAVTATLTAGSITFGGELMLKAGLVNNYHLFGGSGERWGDFSQTNVDPIDPNSFWTTQEYAVSSNTWGTYIAQITVPEPMGGLLTGLALIPLLLARRSKYSLSSRC